MVRKLYSLQKDLLDIAISLLHKERILTDVSEPVRERAGFVINVRVKCDDEKLQNLLTKYLKKNIMVFK